MTLLNTLESEHWVSDSRARNSWQDLGMVVNEIFYSLQGEGFGAGVPSVFIRLAGCPLRCRWCDTRYAWAADSGTEYSVGEVVRIVEQKRCGYAVITGGEPMINRDLPELACGLKACDMHVTIETAGVAHVPGLACDLMSISPKLGNSTPEEAGLAAQHEDRRLDTAVLAELVANYDYQLKFVVDSVKDLAEIQETLEAIGNVDTTKVMLMPQAATRDEYLAKSPMVAQMCKLTGLAFSPRLHVLFGEEHEGM